MTSELFEMPESLSPRQRLAAQPESTMNPSDLDDFIERHGGPFVMDSTASHCRIVCADGDIFPCGGYEMVLCEFLVAALNERWETIRKKT